MTGRVRPGGARVGLIVPSVNTTIEPDFAWAAPTTLSFHTARVMLHATTPEGLRAMNREVESAARLLASTTPDAVAFACTSGTFLDGDAALTRQLQDIAGIVGCPVVATSRAIIDACRALGLRRLALATPYLDVINLAEHAFLSEQGLDVVAMKGLGLSGKAIREVPPDAVAALVRETDCAAAEAVFVSCTDFRALEIVDELEHELGKPIITSNSVTLWGILKALGLPTHVAGLGRLLGA